MPTPPPIPLKPKPDWWSRNWKWFVPLVGVAGLLVITGFVFSIFAIMKSSDAYVGAVTRARASSEVVAALGSPIEEGLIVSGNVSLSGSGGEAELSIPIKGPNDNATIYVVAHKFGGQWHYEKLLVRVGNSGEIIDLSDE